MHAHHCTPAVADAPPTARKIALVGNPNTGKSVFFNALTGLYVDVSNFPGTTVDVAQGRWGGDIVVDTPGIYGVAAYNDEERVARDLILQADLIVNVVDAVHLERDLFLTMQLIDMGLPLARGREHDGRGRETGSRGRPGADCRKLWASLSCQRWLWKAGGWRS